MGERQVAQPEPVRGPAGQCPRTRKVQYDTIEEARKARKRMRKTWGSKLHPYVCPYCGLYHIGHQRRRRVL